jgi:hypothetical protein
LKKLKNWAARSYLASLLFLLIIPCHGITSQNQGLSIKAENAPYNQMLQKMETKTEDKLAMKSQAAAAAGAKGSGDASVVIVDPLVRASDFKEAFTYLLQYKAGAPIFFALQNGERLYNVIDLSVMKGGSLVIFKMNTTQGQKLKVVKTEDIISLGVD